MSAPFMIGVSGGSGKTTISGQLQAMVGAAHVAYLQAILARV